MTKEKESANVVQFPLWIKDFNENINEHFNHLTEIEIFEECLKMYELAKEKYGDMSPKEKREFDRQNALIQIQMKNIFDLLGESEP